MKIPVARPVPAVALARTAVLVAALATAGAAAAAERALSIGNRDLDFLSWREDGARRGVETLALDAGRLEAVRAGEHPFIERLRQTSIEFRADGTVHERFVRARLYLTRDGPRTAGEFAVWVDAHSERLVIESAYTLAPDGTRVTVDAGTVQVTVPAEDRIFTDYVRAVVPFPALEPGAIAVLAGTRVHHDTGFPLPWSRLLYPRLFEPVEDFVAEISWENDAVRPVWSTDLDGLACKDVAPRQVRCEAHALEPFDTDPDVAYQDVMPSLIVAERSAWSEIATRMRTLVQGSLGDGELAGLAREIAPPDAPPEQRLASLHRFVTEEIRYVGLEQGLGGVVPRPSTVTLARRYGDCKDMTTLFVDLARHAGLDAYAVLSASERLEPARLLLPASGYFDHMIACVNMPSGEERCVDLTDPYSPATTLSSGLQGTVRLDLRDGVQGPATLAEEEFRWVLEVDTESRLEADGALVEEQRRRYEGAFGAWVRGQVAGLSAAERDEWGVEDYRGNVSRDAKPVVELRGVDAVHEDVDLHTTTRFDTFFEPGPRADVADLDSWLTYVASSFSSDNEHHDYRFDGIRFRSKVVYTLPDGYRALHLGAGVDYSSEFGRLTRHWREAGGAVEVETRFDAPRRRVGLEEIERFNAFLERVGEESYLDLSIAAREGAGR